MPHSFSGCYARGGRLRRLPDEGLIHVNRLSLYFSAAAEWSEIDVFERALRV